jgi:ABC-type Fe3+ transport system permease subunit
LAGWGYQIGLQRYGQSRQAASSGRRQRDDAGPVPEFGDRVGLLGTFVGPILAHTAINLPFVIWLIMGFIRDLPDDLEAAALWMVANRCKYRQRDDRWCR